MAKPAKSWGQYSRAYRDRATKQAAAHGLSRRSAREMFNRGTFKPFARDEAKRVPLKIARQSRSTSVPTSGTRSEQEVRATILAKLDFKLSDSHKYTPGARADIGDTLDKLPLNQLLQYERAIDNADIRDLASAQTRKDMGAYKKLSSKDQHGNFQNPFWYHKR